MCQAKRLELAAKDVGILWGINSTLRETDSGTTYLIVFKQENGAAERNRTFGLALTKGALYP